MAEPAASGIQIGVAVASGIAGYVFNNLGLSLPLLFVGLASAGLGAINAPKMPIPALVGAWLCAGVCCTWIGIGAADIAALILRAKLPESITFLSVVLSGFAAHPMVRWVGSRFDAMADAGAGKIGIATSSTKGQE